MLATRGYNSYETAERAIKLATLQAIQIPHKNSPETHSMFDNRYKVTKIVMLGINVFFNYKRVDIKSLIKTTNLEMDAEYNSVAVWLDAGTRMRIHPDGKGQLAVVSYPNTTFNHHQIVSFVATTCKRAEEILLKFSVRETT